MMKLYAPFIREATLRVTMTLRSEGHGGDPSPKLQGGRLVLVLFNFAQSHLAAYRELTGTRDTRAIHIYPPP